jgi:Uma2 family endonuclease
VSRSTLPIIATDLPVLYEDDGERSVGTSGLPLLYEDEGQEEMGETRPHDLVEGILQCALTPHFAARPGHEVLADMSLYYHPDDRRAYVSPDLMVVTPAPLPMGLRHYRVGETGPAPVLAAEVLSRRTFQQHDLTLKPGLYADLGVREYWLLDATGEFLPERLLLRTLEPGDRAWTDEYDQGGGLTSRFGFRVAFQPDGLPRVFDAATGWAYPRPEEADAEARARAVAEAAWRAEAAARQAAEQA